MYWRNALVNILFKTTFFGRQGSPESRKDSASMADFGYNDNAIRNQTIIQTISHGNVAYLACFS